MANRYWVGTNGNWHSAANWSATSGGAGGAGVPTDSDDVYIDGHGYVFIEAHAAIICNNFNLSASMTELLILYEGGVIHGDYTQDAGYYASIGEDIIEFKGNITLNAGTFTTGSVGGENPPHTLLSGNNKIVTNNSSGNVNCQWLTISGSITTAGSRLQTIRVGGDLKDVSALTIAAGNRLLIDDGATWTDLTGIIDGDGYILFIPNTSANIPITGTINCEFQIQYLHNWTLPARTWGGNFLIDVRANNLIFTMGEGKHYFNGQFQILADNASITTRWTLDCAANNAEFRSLGKWYVNTNSFKQPSEFVLNLGGGIHIFYDEFQLGLFGTTTDMVLNPGDSTVILNPMKAIIYQYRMSRVVSGMPSTHQTLTWNKVYLLKTMSGLAVGIRFIEAFICKEGRFEFFDISTRGIRLRNYQLIPQHRHEFDKLVIVGYDYEKPIWGYFPNQLSFHTEVTINKDVESFGITIQNVKTNVNDLVTYNSVLAGTQNDGIILYNRDIKRIGQRNILNNSYKIISDPVPNLWIEKLIQKVA